MKTGSSDEIKTDLLRQLAAQIEAELATIREAADATHAAATHPDAKAENKYDTRGLEASYLAGAQKERVSELEATLEAIRATASRAFGPEDKIAATALVDLELGSGQLLTVFVLRYAAGYALKAAGRAVQTVTVGAPLGLALLGKTVGEAATVEAKDGTREYEIVAIL